MVYTVTYKGQSNNMEIISLFLNCSKPRVVWTLENLLKLYFDLEIGC